MEPENINEEQAKKFEVWAKRKREELNTCKLSNNQKTPPCFIHDTIAGFLYHVGLENVDVVDLETAKRIKKIGFNKPTYWYWQDKTLPFVEKGLKRVKYNKRRMNHNRYDEWIYSAPTRDEIARWVNLL
jgi:hypothetical protein